MLINLLGSEDIKSAIISLLISVPVILLALTFHEYAHGYVAYRCGDSTAKAFGRLSLDPTKHLDLMGTLCMLIAGFGWAKPVPVNTRNLRKPKRDMVLVSLAGPVANLLLAFVACFLAQLTVFISVKAGWFVPQEGNFAYYPKETASLAMFYVYILFDLMALMNIGLAMFNLIPLPPLDGSKILAGILPPKTAMRYLQLERSMGMILMVVMLLSFTSAGDLVFVPLNWLRGVVYNGFTGLFSLIFGGLM